MTLTHGSLFSGIGGFELAAQWAGIPTRWNCEKEPFCRLVLKQHFPHAKQYENIFDLKDPQPVDIISGGFPCQPFSHAGKRKGTADDRYLWPEMLRVIRDVRPRWVIAENVSGLLSQQGGMVFEQVCTQMEAEGYEVQPFLIPACGVNAPHKRKRVWIIAHAPSIYVQRCAGKQGEVKFGRINVCGFNSHSASIRSIQANREREPRFLNEDSAGNYWEDFPTQPPVCNGDDGVSSGLVRYTRKRFSKLRKEAIKAGGNAIVPQVAYQIFKAIKETEGI